VKPRPMAEPASRRRSAAGCRSAKPTLRLCRGIAKPDFEARQCSIQNCVAGEDCARAGQSNGTMKKLLLGAPACTQRCAGEWRLVPASAKGCGPEVLRAEGLVEQAHISLFMSLRNPYSFSASRYGVFAS
jgi:hypothetical protein